MFVSRPVVHPVEAPPLREGGNNAPRVRMKDVQGMAGTPGGLVLRLFQFLSAVVSLCVMVTISDFSSVTAFWCDFLVRFPFKYVEKKTPPCQTSFVVLSGDVNCIHSILLHFPNLLHVMDNIGCLIVIGYWKRLYIIMLEYALSNCCPTCNNDTIGDEDQGILMVNWCNLMSGFQFRFNLPPLQLFVNKDNIQLLCFFCVSYLVVAVSLQSLWSLSLAIMDIYALLVRRSLRNSGIISVFTVGDGITSTLTFSAACASAGITVLIENDMDRCAMNPCTRFETATAMAFISWFAVSPSFFLNFWSLASQ
ncbi:CASP-like protein 5A1 [Vitis vinifera]|uniref:CASP-like protein n=1 Tax=Vitis vinifera TaxID=29760 RepID=A0A438D3U6_VITVI|nr:CASP-like protein 5A1 [Vitis vinifera]